MEFTQILDTSVLPEDLCRLQTVTVPRPSSQQKETPSSSEISREEEGEEKSPPLEINEEEEITYTFAKIKDGDMKGAIYLMDEEDDTKGVLVARIFNTVEKEGIPDIIDENSVYLPFMDGQIVMEWVLPNGVSQFSSMKDIFAANSHWMNPGEKLLPTFEKGGGLNFSKAMGPPEKGITRIYVVTTRWNMYTSHLNMMDNEIIISFVGECDLDGNMIIHDLPEAAEEMIHRSFYPPPREIMKGKIFAQLPIPKDQVTQFMTTGFTGNFGESMIELKKKEGQSFYHSTVKHTSKDVLDAEYMLGQNPNLFNSFFRNCDVSEENYLETYPVIGAPSDYQLNHFLESSATHLLQIPEEWKNKVQLSHKESRARNVLLCMLEAVPPHKHKLLVSAFFRWKNGRDRTIIFIMKHHVNIRMGRFDEILARKEKALKRMKDIVKTAEAYAYNQRKKGKYYLESLNTSIKGLVYKEYASTYYQILSALDIIQNVDEEYGLTKVIADKIKEEENKLEQVIAEVNEEK